MLIDSHCHLDHRYFEPEGAANIIERAHAAGVERLLTISTHVSRFPLIRDLIEKNPSVFGSVGTHPHHAAEEPDTPLQTLIDLSQHPKVIAIGEAGLDYHYDFAPRDIQAQVFRNHIAAARETKLPLVIHARNADNDIGDILEEESQKGAFPALLHCFSSGRSLAERALALGLYISFSGILTFKTSQELRDIARDVPLDRLLVETDAPYLAPNPFRGKRNEPAYVVHTAQVLAEVKGVTHDYIARQTSDNFFRLFAKAVR